MSGKMVVLNFDHELGLERLPLRRTAGGPSARAPRRVAGESGWRDESFQLASERLLVAAANGRGETDVMQKAVIAIEPEQERADHRFALVVAETADHAVGAAVVLDLLHSAALARAIVEITALGDDAVEHGADILKPTLGLAELGGGGGQSNSPLVSEISMREVLQLTASFAQREVNESIAAGISQQIEDDQQRRRFHG